MSQNRVVRGVVLVEVALVIRGVDDGFARRNIGCHAMLGQATANTEHHISLAQEMIHWPSHDTTTGPERERMVFWKRTLSFQGGHHGYLQQLGQLHQLGTGFGIQHPLTGMNDWLARLQQDCGGFGNVLGVASRVGWFDHTVGLDNGLIHFFQGHIRRDFYHDRPWPTHLEQIEGAPHDFRDLFRLVERFDRLGD